MFSHQSRKFLDPNRSAEEYRFQTVHLETVDATILLETQATLGLTRCEGRQLHLL